MIPTWNAGPDFPELLRWLRAQQPAEILREIVVVDSSSTDGTEEIARAAGARCTRIPRAEFDHGGTRRRAAESCTGSVVVFLVQDALPVGDRFLETLLRPLEEPGMAASYARVVPRAGASLLVRRDVERDLVAGCARLRKRLRSADEWSAWTPSERRIFAHFSDVAAAVRADVLRALPYRDLAFGEDLEWAKRALEAGRGIAFEPDAVVEHSHESGLARDFRRHRDDAIVERRLFGIRRPGSLPGALARAARLTLRDLGGRPRLLAPGLRLAQSLGRWWGARSVEDL